MTSQSQIVGIGRLVNHLLVSICLRGRVSRCHVDCNQSTSTCQHLHLSLLHKLSGTMLNTKHLSTLLHTPDRATLWKQHSTYKTLTGWLSPSITQIWTNLPVSLVTVKLLICQQNVQVVREQIRSNYLQPSPAPLLHLSLFFSTYSSSPVFNTWNLKVMFFLASIDVILCTLVFALWSALQSNLSCTMLTLLSCYACHHPPFGCETKCHFACLKLSISKWLFYAWIVIKLLQDSEWLASICPENQYVCSSFCLDR